MNLADLPERRRGQILAVAAKYGARNVRVFGPVARGQAQPDSDVDILVSFEPGRSLLHHAALQLELESLLGRSVDIATERGLQPKYRRRILAEAITL